MVERREGTSTEGRGLGHSFAADNVERGEAGVDFIKRRPTYPIGDNPRGREINFQADDLNEAYGSTRNPVFRAYRGQAPLEGQTFGTPARVSSLDSISDLRPELPPRSVDTVALDAIKAEEIALLEESNWSLLFPTASFVTPSPGATFSPGATIKVEVNSSDLRGIYSAVLSVGGTLVERRRIDPRDRDVNKNQKFIFLYQIPTDQALGSLDITVRVMNIASSNQGFIADDALNAPPLTDDVNSGVGTLDGRLGRLGSTSKTNPQLAESGFVRTPEAVISLTVNIV